MLVVFGWGHQTRTDYGPAFFTTCANCSNQGWLHLIHVRVWFTLFFIPIIPYDSKHYLVCGICNHGIEITGEHVATAKNLAKATAGYLNREITYDDYAAALSRLAGTVLPKRPDPADEETDADFARRRRRTNKTTGQTFTRCPRCGHWAPCEEATCSRCGHTWLNEPPAKMAAAGIDDTLRQCPRCGNWASPQEATCPRCGHALLNASSPVLAAHVGGYSRRYRDSKRSNLFTTMVLGAAAFLVVGIVSLLLLRDGEGSLPTQAQLPVGSAPSEKAGAAPAQASDTATGVPVQTATPTATRTATATPTVVPTVTPTPLPVRLPTELIKKSRDTAALGTLTIKNGMDNAALAILTTVSDEDEAVLSGTIDAGGTLIMTNIPDGEYWLYFSRGRNWDPAKKKFTQNVSYSKFADTFAFETTHETTRDLYTTWEVTLYKVEGGNAPTTPVSEAKFPDAE